MTRQPQSIRDLHNTCSGRVFILGNGPSIRDQLPLLHKLKGEATFGCNTLLSWKELPFTPTYYGVTDINDASVLNRVVYPEAEGMVRFHIGWAGEQYPRNEAFIWIEKAHDSIQIWNSGFAGLRDELEIVPTGRTTPLTNAQVAAWLGYREFYFLGIEQTTTGYAHAPNSSENGLRGLVRNDHPRIYNGVALNFAKAVADVESVGGTMMDCTPNGLLNDTGRDGIRRGIQRKAVLKYVPLEEVLA